LRDVAGRKGRRQADNQGRDLRLRPQRSVALKDGAIDYKINYRQSSNDADYVFEYLQNNL
jgi:hypothetical protein